MNDPRRLVLDANILFRSVLGVKTRKIVTEFGNCFLA